MRNILEYKGFTGSVEIDFPSHLLHGRIEGIRDLVTFESETVSGIIQEFHSTVDDYLDFCHEVSKIPNMNVHELEMVAVN